MKKHKILLFLQNGIGDAVMRLSALHRLREYYQDSKIVVLVGNRAIYEILKKEKLVDEYIEIKNKNSYSIFSKLNKLYHYKELIEEINSHDFDKVFYFEGRPIPLTMLSFFVNVKEQYMVADFILSSLKSKIVKLGHRQVHKSISANLLLELDRITTNCSYPRFQNIGQNEKDKNSIAILSGSSPMEDFKKWPFEYYNEFINMMIQKNPNYKFYFFGIKNEKVILDYIENKEVVVDCFGKYTLEESIEELSKCSIAIGGDSGMMHIASALGLECYAIFGPTLPYWIGPRGDNVKIIQSNYHCIECVKDRKFGCSTKECMYEVKPKNIMMEINKYE
jgi:ADP-heptose:LPS heptosyltransferase